MRPIGGELEEKKSVYSHYFTDSGRSSLRLFLRSSNHKTKKYLIPNFFCEVIEEILKEEQIDYEFYNILNTLNVDIESIRSKEYDVLYLINYFGMIQSLDSIDISSKIIIEDNVFFNDFNNHGNYIDWYAFNSFRKITPLADGSLIKTNLEIDKHHILNKEALFLEKKREAKDIKYNYLYSQISDEMEYIKLFEEAEAILDNQKEIFKISSYSLLSLFQERHNQELERRRYLQLKKLFSQYTFAHDVQHYSVFPLKLKERDELRAYLMKKNIYLPIHWPESSQKNRLYDEIISIPLFIQYKEDEFNHMIDAIEEFFNERYK